MRDVEGRLAGSAAWRSSRRRHRLREVARAPRRRRRPSQRRARPQPRAPRAGCSQRPRGRRRQRRDLQGRRRQGHRQADDQPVGRRRRPTSPSPSACSSRSATRSRRTRSPRRSPGRASTPARSTSSSRTGAIPTSRRRTSPTRRSPTDAGPNGITGIIGWYVPGGWSTKYPDITDWNNLNKYADLFKTPESRRQGPVPRRDPTFVQYDEALITNLGLNYKVVFSGSEAATITAFQQADKNKTPLLGYFYDPQWLQSEIKLVQVKLPPYTAGCDAGPQEGRLRLPAVRAEQDRLDGVLDKRRRGRHVHQELQVEQRRPELGRRRDHEQEAERRGRRQGVDRRQSRPCGRRGCPPPRPGLISMPASHRGAGIVVSASDREFP